MDRLEQLHLKESEIGAQMKTRYEEATTPNKRKIENLKKALEESLARSQIQKDWIRVLLQTKQDWFTSFGQGLGRMGKTSIRTPHLPSRLGKAVHRR